MVVGGLMLWIQIYCSWWLYSIDVRICHQVSWEAGKVLKVGKGLVLLRSAASCFCRWYYQEIRQSYLTAILYERKIVSCRMTTRPFRKPFFCYYVTCFTLLFLVYADLIFLLYMAFGTVLRYWWHVVKSLLYLLFLQTMVFNTEGTI